RHTSVSKKSNDTARIRPLLCSINSATRHSDSSRFQRSAGRSRVEAEFMLIRLKVTGPVWPGLRLHSIADGPREAPWVSASQWLLRFAPSAPPSTPDRGHPETCSQ